MTLQDYDVAHVLQADRRADAARHRLATEAVRNSTQPSVRSFSAYAGATRRLFGWVPGQRALISRGSQAQHVAGV